jgi:hypothetical protein
MPIGLRNRDTEREDHEEEWAEGFIPSIKVDEGHCFVCGRTNAELLHLRDDIIAKYNTRIDGLKSRMKDFSTKEIRHLTEVIDGTANSEHLDFKVGTVRIDLMKFEKLIPGVRGLIEEASHDDDGRTLSYVREQVIRERDALIISQRNESNNELARLTKERDLLASSTEINFAVGRYSMKISRLYGSECSGGWSGPNRDRTEQERLMDGIRKIGLTVHLCPICREMFNKASEAAFEARSLDDD